MLVTCYGTLKKGYGNHRILANATPLGGCTIRNLKLYYAGFPVASESAGDSVRGELYDIGDIEINDDAKIILSNLDRLEGYRESNPDTSMYHRKTVNVLCDDGNTYESQIYIGNEKYWSNFKGMRDCDVKEGFYTWG